MNDNCILWFRKDLRLDDNPALMEAAKHKKIIPLFIFDRNLEEYNNIGEASHWWLEKSLISLNKEFNQRLNILEGDATASNGTSNENRLGILFKVSPLSARIPPLKINILP